MVKAKETNLEGILEGKKQYQVPLYQRVYSWGRKQVDQLWDDILEVADTRRQDPSATHFIGSLVLAASPDNAAVGLQKFLVVDGQQRLMTLTILLAALRDYQDEVSGGNHRDRIDAQYLLNRFEPREPVKVLPTQADRSAYLSVVKSGADAGGEDAVGSAYRRFRANIAEVDDPEDPHDITAIENAVLRGLAVVAVTAEPGDNAHRIFESLNNTGLKLTQADLLKNYLFMRLGSRAEHVHENVWAPMQKQLDSDSLELLFWLDLVQTDERAKQSETYLGQQRRLEKLVSGDEIEAEITRISKLGDVLATILKPEKEKNLDVRHRLERISSWGSTTALPVVLHVLARRAAGTASDQQVTDALLTLESYFVRRIVTGRATAGLNRSLMQAVSAISGANAVDVALRDYLSEGRKYYATDNQVRESVHSVPFYWQGRASQKKLILQWLEESYRPKEKIDSKGLTIEHVLPQTLTDATRDAFAAGLPAEADIAYEHERVVHTLGNLTLTGYNSELSNRSFESKKLLLAESGLFMNGQIAKHDCWRAEEIEARGTELAEQIIKLWPGPNESLIGSQSRDSNLRSVVTAILASIPAGRWTTYGEVAVVAGNYAQPVANVITGSSVSNAWRVLQAAGTVSEQFRWSDPGRRDDPVELLRSEGVVFDDKGRASEQHFLDAAELALFAGLDVDPETVRIRSRRRRRRAADDPESLGAQQRAFWNLVREVGKEQAQHLNLGRTPRAQHYYDISIGVSGVGVSLTVNSQTKVVAVELYISDDKQLFARLHEQRERIEADLGVSLDWRSLPDKKASRILIARHGDFTDAGETLQLAGWLISTADTFVRVFRKYIYPKGRKPALAAVKPSPLL